MFFPTILTIHFMTTVMAQAFDVFYDSVLRVTLDLNNQNDVSPVISPDLIYISELPLDTLTATLMSFGLITMARH